MENQKRDLLTSDDAVVLPVGDQDLTGKIVVIKHTSMRPRYQTRDYQLWKVTHGPGCVPDSFTGTIHATCIHDEDTAVWQRDADVLGIYTEARTGLFCFDGCIDNIFTGYTTGETWNGFACPMFTKEEGLKIVDFFNKAFAECETESPSCYDKELDAFSFAIEGTDTFDSLDKIINGETVKLYPIGAWGWIWNEVDKPDIKPYQVQYFLALDVEATDPDEAAEEAWKQIKRWSAEYLRDCLGEAHIQEIDPEDI